MSSFFLYNNDDDLIDSDKIESLWCSPEKFSSVKKQTAIDIVKIGYVKSVSDTDLPTNALVILVKNIYFLPTS